jgi:hypothetical protein
LMWMLAAERSSWEAFTNVWRYGEEAVHTDETVWTLTGTNSRITDRINTICIPYQRFDCLLLVLHSFRSRVLVSRMILDVCFSMGIIGTDLNVRSCSNVIHRSAEVPSLIPTALPTSHHSQVPLLLANAFRIAFPSPQNPHPPHISFSQIGPTICSSVAPLYKKFTPPLFCLAVSVCLKKDQRVLGDD